MPYVSETDLSQCGDCPMLIIACDGVWDVFTDQEAADLLMERYSAEGPYSDAAELLVSFSESSILLDKLCVKFNVDEFLPCL